VLLSHKHRFIFVKTRKTGGSSLQAFLAEHCGPDDVLPPLEGYESRNYRGLSNPILDFVQGGHSNMSEIWLNLFQRRRYFNHMEAFKIRNRVGKKVWDSYFKFCVERNPWEKVVSRYWWKFRDEDEPPPFKDYVFGDYDLGSDWSRYTLNGRIAVDFIGRYERLESDLAEICRRIGIPFGAGLPRHKSGIRRNTKHYSDYYDEPSVAKIATVYHREIAEFGYRFEPRLASDVA
jgi:sulfotransferase famil protein